MNNRLTRALGEAPAVRAAGGVSEATRGLIPQWVRNHPRMTALLAGGTVLGATQLDEIERFVTGEATFGELAREDYDAAMSWLDLASNEIASGAEQVATETVQISWASFRENIYAGIESLGLLWNSFMGGDSGLGVINWARNFQNDRPPLEFDRATGSLVETVVPDADPANPNGPDTAVTPDLGRFESLTRVFEHAAFETALTETLDARLMSVADLTDEDGIAAILESTFARMEADGTASEETLDLARSRLDELVASEDLAGAFGDASVGVDAMIANVGSMLTNLQTAITGHATARVTADAEAAARAPDYSSYYGQYMPGG